MEKAKLFYNFILKSERKGFEFLLRAIQDFAKNSNSYKKYGKLFISTVFSLTITPHMQKL